MNKIQKCLFIAKYLKDKGACTREDITDALSERFPEDSPMSKSTFQRYINFIEENLTCIISFNKSDRTYSIKVPDLTDGNSRKMVDRLLEDKEDILKGEQVYVNTSYIAMVYIATYRVRNNMNTTEIPAKNREEALLKAKDFCGDTLEIMMEIPLSCIDNGNYINNITLDNCIVFWKKNMVSVSKGNMFFNIEAIANDMNKKLNEFKDYLDANPEFVEKMFVECSNTALPSEIIEKVTSNSDLYKTYLEVFKLGLVYNYLESKEHDNAKKILYNHIEAKDCFFDALNMYDGVKKDILDLYLKEGDDLLVFFKFAMLCSFCCIDKEDEGSNELAKDKDK